MAAGEYQITATVDDHHIFSRWWGDAVDELPAELLLDILQTIRRSAGRLPITATVVLCEHIEEEDEEDEEIASKDFVYAATDMAERRYMYAMEREYTVFFMADVKADFVFSIEREQVITILPP